MTEYVPTIISECLRIVVCTRNRNWDSEAYQRGVIEPYNRIQELQEKLEKEEKEPTTEQMLDALEMLRTVFMAKKVPLDEQIERFNEVFDKTNTRHLFPEFKMPIAEEALD